MTAALSWVRANAERYGVDPDFFRKHDIHIHVPSGAVPKDGPSAGVAMVTALVSLLDGTAGAATRRHDWRDFAFRLRAAGGRDQGKGAGRKASRHTEVILPAENEANVKEDLENVLEGIQIHYVKNADQALGICAR